MKQVIQFIKDQLNDSLVYEFVYDKNIDVQCEYVFDFEMRFNSHLIYGSVHIAETFDNKYQIFDSDISIPYKKVEIPKTLQSCICEIDIHDWGEDQHHHFITKKPITSSQLRAILKFFFKLYLFADRDTATF